MVRSRDADATRARILAAAAEEFCAHGLAGARVDEIAARAQANKRLLYCYFGDKEQLYAAVLEDHLCRFAQLAMDDAASVGEWVGELFDVLAANPELPRMLLWEGLHYGTRPVPGEESRRARLGERLERLVEAQRRGLVDDTLEPDQTLFTLFGLAAWWFAAPQLARLVTGADPTTPESLSRRRAAAVDAARRLLAPAPKPAKASA